MTRSSTFQGECVDDDILQYIVLIRLLIRLLIAQELKYTFAKANLD